MVALLSRTLYSISPVQELKSSQSKNTYFRLLFCIFSRYKESRFATGFGFCPCKSINEGTRTISSALDNTHCRQFRTISWVSLLMSLHLKSFLQFSWSRLCPCAWLFHSGSRSTFLPSAVLLPWKPMPIFQSAMDLFHPFEPLDGAECFSMPFLLLLVLALLNLLH